MPAEIQVAVGFTLLLRGLLGSLVRSDRTGQPFPRNTRGLMLVRHLGSWVQLNAHLRRVRVASMAHGDFLGRHGVVFTTLWGPFFSVDGVLLGGNFRYHFVAAISHHDWLAGTEVTTRAVTFLRRTRAITREYHFYTDSYQGIDSHRTT